MEEWAERLDLLDFIPKFYALGLNSPDLIAILPRQEREDLARELHLDYGRKARFLQETDSMEASYFRQIKQPNVTPSRAYNPSPHHPPLHSPHPLRDPLVLKPKLEFVDISSEESLVEEDKKKPILIQEPDFDLDLNLRIQSPKKTESEPNPKKRKSERLLLQKTKKQKIETETKKVTKQKKTKKTKKNTTKTKI